MSYEEEVWRNSGTDHDLLIKIHSNIETHMSDFRAHKETFREHIKSDQEDFKTLYRFMWIITGGFAIVELGMRLFK